MRAAARRSVALVAALLTAAMAPLATARDCVVSRAGWDGPALRLTVGRAGREQILAVEGRIGPDLPRRLKAVLARYPAISEIRFHSSGGDAASAMEAGRLIRATGNFAAHVPDGWGCVDACALLFLSGRIRSVAPGGVFDVGRFQDGGAGRAGAEAAARRSLGVADYLIAMGVSRRLLMAALNRAESGDVAAGQRCLTAEELHRYNVANWNG